MPLSKNISFKQFLVYILMCIPFFASFFMYSVICFHISLYVLHLIQYPVNTRQDRHDYIKKCKGYINFMVVVQMSHEVLGIQSYALSVIQLSENRIIHTSFILFCFLYIHSLFNIGHVLCNKLKCLDRMKGFNNTNRFGNTGQGRVNHDL